MTALTFAAVLQTALLSTGGAKYEEAHQLNVQTGRPLVVLIGAEWCPACKVMKDSTIPQVAQRGVLSQVAFAQVDADAETALARKLTGGGGIPQLIMYHQTAEGWKRDVMIGAKSVDEVETFLRQGLATQTPVLLGSN